MILAVIVIVIIAVAVGLVVSSSNNEESGGDGEPTTPPTTQTTSDWEYLRDQLLASSISPNRFSDPLSSQYMALDWLVHEDPAGLDIRETDRSTLFHRYILAVLFFSTNGYDWTEPRGFLSNSSVCDWTGITCDVTESITEIAIGTSIA